MQVEYIYLYLLHVVSGAEDAEINQFDARGTLLLSNECPPMIPNYSRFEDKIGERLIVVTGKRRKYFGYHYRYVFKS